MARKTNRYKLKTNGLEIEKSMNTEWCNGKTDKDIIEKILRDIGYLSVLDSYENGRREIELIVIRDHNS